MVIMRVYSTNSDLQKYHGTEVEVLRAFNDSEKCEMNKAGFWVKFCDGTIGIVFEDELKE